MSTKRAQSGVSGQRPPSSRLGTATGAKLPVAEPASIGKFAVILLMHICKKILLFDTTTKLAIYVFCITVLSVVTDMFPFPKTYFSDKRNALNQVFVKWGWGWTCTVLGVFIYFTRYVGIVALAALHAAAKKNIIYFTALAVLRGRPHSAYSTAAAVDR